MPSKFKYGDIRTTTHINLPLRPVEPRPFRPSIDTLTYKDTSTILEELGLLDDKFSLLTLKTSQKYFVPQTTYQM